MLFLSSARKKKLRKRGLVFIFLVDTIIVDNTGYFVSLAEMGAMCPRFNTAFCAKGST